MKTEKSALMMLAIILIPFVCLAAFVFGVDSYHMDFYSRYGLTAGQEEEIAYALGFDLAPSDKMSVSYNPGFWPKTIDYLSVYIEGIPSEEEFLARCHEETALKWWSGIYEHQKSASCTVDSGDARLKSVEKMINNRWEPWVLQCVLWGGLAAEVALIAGYRKARKKKSPAGADNALPLKIVRIVLTILAIGAIFLGCLFSFYGLLIFRLVDDIRHLNAEEQIVVAQMLGYDIAPDEDLSDVWFSQGFWPGSIDRIWSEFSIASEEEFFARCHEKTAFELHTYKRNDGSHYYHAELEISRNSEFMTKELVRLLNQDWLPYLLLFILFWSILLGKTALIITLFVKHVKKRKASPMKHLVILYDGMSDTPVPALGGKTPMQCAQKPIFDALGRDAEVGMVRTVPPGQKPGSDVANLSVLGYDPAQCYTGRSPLEATSIGVPMGEEDLTLRCNLVTLSADEPFAAKTMIDYAGGEITTEEAREVIAAVQSAFGDDQFTYYAGVQYRHCLLWQGAKDKLPALGTLTPPHDIIGRTIGEYLPKGEAAAPLLEMMQRSHDILNAGGAKANCIWLWGEGTRPALPSFEVKTGLKGSIISAVDLLKGIGILAGMRVPEVPGATGWLDTNYEGKAHCAVEEFQSGQDFVYLHFEATDEAGHRGNAEEKILGIELIDQRVLPIVLDYLEPLDDYALLILPDHPTPLAVKTHTSDPVPYMLYRKGWKGSRRGVDCVCEETAEATGKFGTSGVELIEKFLKKD